MKNVNLLIGLLIAAVLVLPGCSSTTPTMVNSTPTTVVSATMTTKVFIDWVDFIKVNDITYLRAFQGDSIDEGGLTAYAEVEFKTAENITLPSYEIQNGDAAFLERGTPIYSMSGYSPNFRLAVKENQELFIYEADTNPNAKAGSDLLDIGGKVESFGINSGYDGTTELASIMEQTTVDNLVQMILDAPVDQLVLKAGKQQYFIEFRLNDGTRVRRAYWLDNGALSRGIQLPVEFGEAISLALDAGEGKNDY